MGFDDVCMMMFNPFSIHLEKNKAIRSWLVHFNIAAPRQGEMRRVQRCCPGNVFPSALPAGFT
jgi:hypothetical protein